MLRQSCRALPFLVIAVLASPLWAQATRTWVSGVGDDANPCSRTAPCKTFAGAISKTVDGGEINVLDAGGYGAVTITKSITIDGGGAFASILASSTNGVVINAAGAIVTLRNLFINGAPPSSPGLRGIKVFAAARVVIENCRIFGFSQRGISIEPNTGTSMIIVISDTTVMNSGLTGIAIQAAVVPPPTMFTTLNRVTVSGSANYGLYADSGSRLTVRDSILSQNGTGIATAAMNAATDVDILNSVLSNNSTGIQASSSSIVRISGVTITRNAVNGFSFNGGTVYSFGNNYVAGNAAGNGPANGGSISPQ